MAKIYKQPFAHSGDASAIPVASQPDGKMSSADGWTPDYQLLKTDPNYKPVGRQEMNGVFKEVTEALGQVQVQGAATWSAEGAPYPVNAQVYHSGKQWLALRDNSVDPAEGADWTELVGKQYIDANLPDLAGYLQPSMTGSATLNGTTDNTLALTAIVTTLGLEVGDVIRIQYSGYDKLHTVESITNNDLIIVNYEHAGNRGNGSLKLADITADVTITRIAKWYNAPIGLGQARVSLASIRAKNTNFTNTAGRPVVVEIVTNSLISDILIQFTIDGLMVEQRYRGDAFSTSDSLSAVVPKDSDYQAILGTYSILVWNEWR